MLRRLILWLMIFALPLQALAAGSIGHCAAERTDAMTMTMTMAQHDTASMQMHADHQLANAHKHDNQQHGSMHDAGKCSPCCTGAMAAAHIAPLTLSKATTVFAASPVPTFTSVILEGPQRPPRPSFA